MGLSCSGGPSHLDPTYAVLASPLWSTFLAPTPGPYQPVPQTLGTPQRLCTETSDTKDLKTQGLSYWPEIM